MPGVRCSLDTFHHARQNMAFIVPFVWTARMFEMRFAALIWEKYKAKNLVDVVIYRGSDALSGWIFDSLQALGLKLGAIALVSLPVVAGWTALSIALGRTQEKRSAKPGVKSVSETGREYRFDTA